MKVGFITTGLCVVLAASASDTGVTKAQTTDGLEQGNTVRVMANFAALRCHEKIAREFAGQRADWAVKVTGCRNADGIEALAAGKCDVLVYAGALDDQAKAKLAGAFPERQPAALPFGRFCVAVVVNKANPINSVSLEQLAGIYTGRLRRWNDVQAGALEGQGITAFSQAAKSNSNYIVQSKAFPGAAFGDSIKPLASGADAIKAVASTPSAVAILLCNDDAMWAGVRALAVKATGASEAALPTIQNVFNSSYPLTDELTVYTNPSSPPGRQYAQFACGAEGRQAARDFLLYSHSECQRAEGARRLKELKVRGGPQMQIAGPKEFSTLVESLNVEFAGQREPALANYTAALQTAVIGGLLIRQEIALTQGPLSADTVRLHAAGFKQLHPRDYVLGACGTAIIVNRQNRLSSLTIDQLKVIFSRKVDDWRLLDASPAPLAIRRLAPSRTEPAAALFYEKVLSWAECKHVESKDTSAELIAAVAEDDQSIGFVNLADVLAYQAMQPPTAAGDDGSARRTGLKLLAVGPAEAVVLPNATTVNDGSYPLSSPLTLYLSPRSTDPACKFAEFCASRQCQAVLKKHGFLPPPPPEAWQVAAVSKPVMPTMPAASSITPTSDKPAPSSGGTKGGSSGPGSDIPSTGGRETGPASTGASKPAPAPPPGTSGQLADSGQSSAPGNGSPKFFGLEAKKEPTPPETTGRPASPTAPDSGTGGQSPVTAGLSKDKPTLAAPDAGNPSVTTSELTDSLDLIPLAETNGSGVVGTWVREGNTLQITKDAVPVSKLMIPVSPEGDYEIQVEVTRTTGTDCCAIGLPVGTGHVSMIVDGYSDTFSGLGNIDKKTFADGPTATKMSVFADRNRHAIVVRVLMRGDQAQIIVKIDDKPIINWEGKQSSLAPAEYRKPPNPRAFFLSNWKSTFIFHRIQLRMLSGKATRIASSGDVEKP